MDPALAPYTETLKFLGGAILGAKLRMDAQRAQLETEKFNTLGRVASAMAGESNKNQNDAGQRGSGSERFVFGLIIILTAFGGLIWAMLSNREVLIEATRPVRRWVWGLWETGGQTEFVGGKGLVLPSYVEESVSAVVGFTFGVGAATVYGKAVRRA